MPLPIPTHTLIKIEDGLNNNTPSTNNAHNCSTSIFDPDKNVQASALTTTMQSPSDVAAQLFYQHPGLIQIAPNPPMAHQNTLPAAILSETEISPPLQLTTTSSNIPEPCLSPQMENDQTNMEQPTSCQPEVQDANIQTSPIMSEEENTCGDDMGSSNRYEYEDESQSDPISDKTAMPESFETTCHMNKDESAEKLVTRDDEHVVDSSVSSSISMFPIKKLDDSPDASQIYYEKEFSEDQENEVGLPESNLKEEEQKEPVDLSGLQLLSNSIEVFHKKVIKQEPIDMERVPQITSPTIASTTMTPPMYEQEEKPCSSTTNTDEIEMEPTMQEKPSANEGYTPQELGGLTLLSVVAEQIYHEENVQRSVDEPTQANTDETQYSDADENSEKSVEKSPEKSRKRKHKHSSSKKSSKKSKHEKEKTKNKKRKHSSSDEREDLVGEVGNALKRVKTKYDKWTPSTTEELYRVMETDMKQHLASIHEQILERRKELDKMNTIPEICEKDSSSSCSDKNEEQKPTKISYLGNTAPLKFSIIPALSPSFSSSSNSESISVEIPKLSSDTDSASKFDDQIPSGSRKFGVFSKKQKSESVSEKKPKSLVGYILASKQYDKNGHWTSSIDANKKIKFTPNIEEEGSSLIKESAFKGDKVFSIFGGDKPIIFDKNSQKFTASSPLSINRHTAPSHKHLSKHKKSRSSKERKHRSEKRRLDARVQLSSEHLSKDTKTRVLTAMGGLFYAGYLSAITPPDVYAITLDGERGNRPHIMSREEICRDAVSFN